MKPLWTKAALWTGISALLTAIVVGPLLGSVPPHLGAYCGTTTQTLTTGQK